MNYKASSVMDSGFHPSRVFLIIVSMDEEKQGEVIHLYFLTEKLQNKMKNGVQF